MRYVICIAVAWMLCGCAGQKAQRGGRSEQSIGRGEGPRSKLEQPENPKESSSQTTYRRVEREIVLPAGTKIVDAVSTNKPTIEVTLSAPALMKEKIEEGATTALGGSFADTARALGARLAAMRPVQYVGIVMVLGSLALFYFRWWIIGGLTLAMGVGMIAVAAVLPGHERFILIGGGIIFFLLVSGMLVAYFRAKDENRNHIPDFLERKEPTPSP